MRRSVKLRESRDNSVWDIWGALIWAEKREALRETSLLKYEAGLWFLADGQRQHINPLSIGRSVIMDQPFSRTHWSRSPCFPQRPGLVTNYDQIACVFTGEVRFDPTTEHRRLCRRPYRTKFFPAESPEGGFGVLRLRRRWWRSADWTLHAYSASPSTKVRTGEVRTPMYDANVRLLGHITWIGTNLCRPLPTSESPSQVPQTDE